MQRSEVKRILEDLRLENGEAALPLALCTLIARFYTRISPSHQQGLEDVQKLIKLLGSPDLDRVTISNVSPKVYEKASGLIVNLLKCFGSGEIVQDVTNKMSAYIDTLSGLPELEGPDEEKLPESVLKILEARESFATERLINHVTKTVTRICGHFAVDIMNMLDANIPRLFLILPVDKGQASSTGFYDAAKGRIRSIYSTEFRIHTICECGNHLTNHCGYPVHLTADWVKKVLPILAMSLKVISAGIKVATGVSLGGVGEFIDEIGTNYIDVEIATDVLDNLASVEADGSDVMVDKPNIHDSRKNLFSLLKDFDDKFGDLHQIGTLDGTKWLCKPHADLAIDALS